ncbi:TDP-N-acetylfucosamine:lipid II N-acetylfucosaminyltransferase [Marinobacterium iners]|uniref:TDP-N-acetylfucosamine:lipid II N-acetylfucosaminyltransferase n=1 Tax=Marinobacterium iners TaxID=48076 RepID=UPI001A8D2BAF|nr:TDP-N-acetylfucosamine:lipid II N-acetylfucosaminyltransferase [Marinobacterium iners]
MSSKILHVCNLEKFIPPFTDFIEDNFSLDDHFFWLNGDHDKYPVKQYKSNYKVKRTKTGQVKGLLKLVQLMQVSEKVILHGLSNSKIILILFFMPWLLKKCYWVMWGGDLYVHKLGEKNLKWKLREFFRRPVIKNMGHLVTYIPGDVELARQWYGAKGKHHECLMYLSNVVDPNIVQAAQEKTEGHTSINILVGNSADPSNNHIESLEKLLPYKEDEIKIFVPLSYGDQEHAKKVIETGNAWFGDKFVPLTSFMAFDEYLKFLKSLDIAIFNHQRQQAMGNTIMLLGMGKTVFMRSGVSHWRFLKGLGIKLNDVEKLELCRITTKDAEENASLIRSYFSRENLIRQLNGVLEE